jgi:hypothetical protein
MFSKRLGAILVLAIGLVALRGQEVPTTSEGVHSVSVNCYADTQGPSTPIICE